MSPALTTPLPPPTGRYIRVSVAKPYPGYDYLVDVSLDEENCVKSIHSIHLPSGEACEAMEEDAIDDIHEQINRGKWESHS
jgi:hypothetical protein